MSLEMKYFVVKPGSKKPGDPHAIASRAALRAYADEIRRHDSLMALSLEQWAEKEMNYDALLQRDRRLALDPVAIFFEERCSRMASAFVGLDHLWAAYTTWCDNIDLPFTDKDNFLERCLKQGLHYDRSKDAVVGAVVVGEER